MPFLSEPQVTYTVSGASYTDTDVDNWELRASRRALLNLKRLIKPEVMLSLIQSQIDEGDKYFKNIISESDGTWRDTSTTLRVPDIKLQQIMRVRQKLNADMTTPEGRESFFLEFLAKAHPEHYALPPDYDDGVIEIIGEHMARLNVDKDSEIPSHILAPYQDPSYPAKKAATGRLDDGTVLCYILHQFKDTEEGCELAVRLLFPANAPEVWFKEHAEHLAIEFRNGLKKSWGMWKRGELD
jgi:hypothetical protein